VLQFRWGVPFLLDGFARVAAGEGHAARALRLAGAAAALRADGGAAPGPSWRADLDEHLAPARRALGAAAERCWAEGQALSDEAALAYAVADDRDSR
jgi:hypothetical protein